MLFLLVRHLTIIKASSFEQYIERIEDNTKYIESLNKTNQVNINFHNSKINKSCNDLNINNIEILSTTKNQRKMLVFSELYNQGILKCILFNKKSTLRQNYQNNVFCNTILDKLNKNIFEALKPQLLDLDINMRMKIFYFSSYETIYFLEFINNFLDLFHDEFKDSIKVKRLRSSIFLVFKTLNKKIDVIKEKFQKEHLNKTKEDSLELFKELNKFFNSLSINENELSEQNVEINVFLNTKKINNKKLKFLNKKRNSRKNLNLFDRNRSFNTIKTKFFQKNKICKYEFFNSKKMIYIKRKLKLFFKERNNFNKKFSQNKRKFSFREKTSNFFVYKEIFNIIKDAQLKMIKIFKDYENCFLNFVDKKYEKELYELEKDFNEIIGNKEDFKISQEFFIDSKKQIKCKINLIIDEIENEFTKYLLV